jgi:hypothetical protein
LVQRDGGSGNNLCQVGFDDAAPTPFDGVVGSKAPFTGTWRPEQPLARLLDASTDGDWTFKVADGAPNDTGSVRAVSLEVHGFVTN